MHADGKDEPFAQCMQTAHFTHERKDKMEEYGTDSNGTEMISTSETIRDRLKAIADQDVILVIPIGEDADDYE